MTILRRVAAVIVGLAVAMLLVTLAEQMVHQMYPPPAGMDMKNMELVKAYVAKLPLAPLVIVLAGWLVATFLGALIAGKIARHRIAAYVVGGLLFCAGIANAAMIPAPLWFSVVSFIDYIVATLAAARLVNSTAPAS